MDITNKIDRILNEATFSSQGGIRATMAKGLKDVPDITSRVAMSFWHYFDKKIIGKSGSRNVGIIFKSQPSKKLIDELWFRIGKPVEDSERLTDDGIKKLKKNFYSLSKWTDLYKYNTEKKGWEFAQ